MRSASGKSTRAQARTTESALLSRSLASLVYLDLRSVRHDSASVIGTDNCVGLPVSDAALAATYYLGCTVTKLALHVAGLARPRQETVDASAAACAWHDAAPGWVAARLRDSPSLT
jgi:hypothetical protein